MTGITCTGAILERGENTDGQPAITAAVTLTEADWDRLTAGYRGLHRWLTGDTSLPDLNLEERVGEFLRQETAVWAYDECRTRFEAGGDDDVPI